LHNEDEGNMKDSSAGKATNEIRAAGCPNVEYEGGATWRVPIILVGRDLTRKPIWSALWTLLSNRALGRYTWPIHI